MRTTILNIGDELLLGQVINTNASWLGKQLNQIGIEVEEIRMIPDKEKQIIRALDEARKNSDIIILTGGLGPTKDDITKQTLCKYFKTKLIFHQPSFDNVHNLFSSRGFEISEINRKQAEIPENCVPIENLNGTAPGMWWDIDDKIFISLPGVPYELKAMITEFILPQLNSRFNLQALYNRTILTQGMGESVIAEEISEWEDNLPSNIKLAYLPQPGMVRLRLSGKGENKQEIQEQVDAEVKKLLQYIPKIIFGYEDDTLEQVVGEILKRENKTLSTAESITGGYIAHLITSVPGSSSYFKGSVIAYSNEIKMKMLGVKEKTLIDHGAVSEYTVKEMASGILKNFNTDYAIAVSGIAGPDGATDQKPVGTTWIAIASAMHIRAYHFLFGENRERNIRKASLTALSLLRKELINQ